MCMCIWFNLHARAHITVTSLWFVGIACCSLARGTGGVQAGDETWEVFAQLVLYMVFNISVLSVYAPS